MMMDEERRIAAEVARRVRDIRDVAARVDRIAADLRVVASFDVCDPLGWETMDDDGRDVTRADRGRALARARRDVARAQARLAKIGLDLRAR